MLRFVADAYEAGRRSTSHVTVAILRHAGYGDSLPNMAIPKVKGTYSLDADTVRLLERVSRRWGVSKSEALRRAIRAAAAASDVDQTTEPLDRLQRAAGLTQAAAAAWARHARAQ